MSRARPLLILACTLGGACAIEIDGPAGRTCATANDCPRGLVCVELHRGAPRTCEAVRSADEGEVREPDAGVAYYCSEVKPILEEHCTECHSDPPANDARPTLRLDVYATDGGVPGASQVADRIVYRAAVRRDMPPFPRPEPTDAQLRALRAWEQSGAPFCDAGTEDGGADAGP